MGFWTNINLPDTKDARAIRLYMDVQHTGDLSKAQNLFSEDALFNGLLYKGQGRQAIAKIFTEFGTKMVVSMRLEAITQMEGTNLWIVMFWIVMKGSPEEVSFTDVITVDDGVITRVDNCYDVGKVPGDVKDNAESASNV